MRKRKLNAQAEALAVWRALEPQIVEAVRRETADCVRQKKLTVVTAPNGTTMGVMQPNDTTIFDIPYVSTQCACGDDGAGELFLWYEQHDRRLFGGRDTAGRRLEYAN